MTRVVGTIKSISTPTKEENELSSLEIEVQKGDIKITVTVHTNPQDAIILSRAYNAVAEADALMTKPL